MAIVTPEEKPVPEQSVSKESSALPPAEAKKTEQEPMIPKSRLDEVIGRAQRAEEEVARIAKAEEDRKKAEMAEIDRLKFEGETKDKELGTLRMEKMQREAAEAVGLDPKHAHRLKGTTADELKADAEAFLSTLPKVEAPKKPKVLEPAGVGGDTSEAQETELQKRDRIFGRQTANIFDSSLNRAMGGGVVFSPTENKGGSDQQE